MKEITIRIETSYNMRFVIIEEIRFNNEVIHETVICASKLYEHYTETWELKEAIKRIYDKRITYKYLDNDYPQGNYTKEIKEKLDHMIREYKYNMELNALKRKYRII